VYEYDHYKSSVDIYTKHGQKFMPRKIFETKTAEFQGPYTAIGTNIF